MPQPSNATVTIDGDKIQALSVTVGLATHHDGIGQPQMGTLGCHISVIVDLHNNVEYSLLQKLFELAKIVTRDKIKPIKIEFWQDEHQQDAVCTYSFPGWISDFTTSGGGGSNHTLSMNLVPALDEKNYVDLKMGN
jgi:hypothetical protein